MRSDLPICVGMVFLINAGTIIKATQSQSEARESNGLQSESMGLNSDE